MKVTVTEVRSGPTLDQVLDGVEDSFIEHVLADHRATPDQFAGQGRKGRTPFHRTGTLIGGFTFKRAGKTSRRAGLIGTIRAPASRFNNAALRDKFLAYLLELWSSRGVGWSKGGI